MRRGAPAPSERNVPIPAFEDARSLLLRNPIVRKPHDILRPNEQPQLETTGQENKAVTPRGTEGNIENIRVDNKTYKACGTAMARECIQTNGTSTRPDPFKTTQTAQHRSTTRNERRGGLSAVYSSQPAITATPAASSTAKTSDRAHDQSRLRAPPRGHPRNRNSKAKAPGPGNRR